MKKFLSTCFILSSFINVQALCFPVSCSVKDIFIDDNFNDENKIIEKEFKYDFEKEGVLTNEKIAEKLNKIAEKPENSKFFNHKFFSYKINNRNENDYYIKLNLKKKGMRINIDLYQKYYPDSARDGFSLSSKNFIFTSNSTKSDDIYKKLVDFHKNLVNKDLKYFSQLKDNSLRDISMKMYDDFFKTAFTEENVNKNTDYYPKWEIVKSFYFKESLGNNWSYYSDDGQSGSANQPYLNCNIFSMQIIDNTSGLSLNLTKFNDYAAKVTLFDSSSEYYFPYISSTCVFINKKLSSLIDLRPGNVTLKFNWCKEEDYDSNFDIFHEKIFGINLKTLRKNDNTSDFDVNEKLEKSNHIDVHKIPAYNEIFKDSVNFLNLKDLNIKDMSFLEGNIANNFFQELFYKGKPEQGVFKRECFYNINNLWDCVSAIQITDKIKQQLNLNSDNVIYQNPLLFFYNKSISLSIDENVLNFNFFVVSKKQVEPNYNCDFKLISGDWSKFYTSLINKKSKDLKIVISGNNADAIIKGDLETTIKIN